jgi:hypothetical protein
MYKVSASVNIYCVLCFFVFITFMGLFLNSKKYDFR